MGTEYKYFPPQSHQVAALQDSVGGFYAIETQYRYDAMPAEVLRAYDDILDKHHVTREQVEHSFAYYAEHPDLYAPIQDSVLARIEQVTATDTVIAAAPDHDYRLKL